MNILHTLAGIGSAAVMNILHTLAGIGTHTQIVYEINTQNTITKKKKI